MNILDDEKKVEKKKSKNPDAKGWNPALRLRAVSKATHETLARSVML